MNYYSRGKLLISGEYLVLKGAKALMVPLLKGQTLTIQNTKGTGNLEWISREEGKEWFRAIFNTTLFDILKASDQGIAKKLQLMLKSARKLNGDFLKGHPSIQVETNLEFKRKWGFGSSSSLTANVAQWAGIDPFLLHSRVSKGSGYDVVAAQAESPAFFTRTGKTYVLEETDFYPPFHDRIWFVYLGRKQDSAIIVDHFLKSRKQYRVEKRTITELSQHMAKAQDLKDFEFYMHEHDLVLSSILKQPRLKESRFADLPGEIKPLGAWGGDFAMMTWSDAKEELKRYLNKKKLKTFFGFDELIKTK